MKSVLKVSLAALTLAFAVSSQAADKLVVATDTAFVPFEFKQGDKYVGFDVDLWAAVAKNLAGLHPEANGLQRHHSGAANQKTLTWRWRASPSPKNVKKRSISLTATIKAACW